MSEIPKPSMAVTLDRLAEVRQMDTDELPALRHLHLRAFQQAAATLLSEEEMVQAKAWIYSDDQFQAIVAAARLGQIFGAWIDRTLVSAAGWSSETSTRAPVRLRWLATDPLFASKGIGRRVVVQAEFAATAAGHSRITARALPTYSGFFERLGYRETARGIQAMTRDLDVPAVYLSKLMRHPNVDPSVRH